jgi:hypothetical protein
MLCDLFLTICRDRQHTDIQRLLFHPATTRRLPGCALGMLKVTRPLRWTVPACCTCSTQADSASPPWTTGRARSAGAACGPGRSPYLPSKEDVGIAQNDIERGAQPLRR